MLSSCDVLRSRSKASWPLTWCAAMSSPTALPISRLLCSPSRRVAASSRARIAISATEANDAMTAPTSADFAVSPLGVSEKMLRAPTLSPSSSSR